MDLLLKRYGSLSEVAGLPLDTFLELIEMAYEKENDARIRAQWCAHLPYMSMQMLKYVSFKDYKDQVTGRNIDLRPASVIMAEIEEAHRLAGMR